MRKAIALTTAALALSLVVAEAAEKVYVCHLGSTLEIAESALAAHLGHGDTAGACPTATTVPTATLLPTATMVPTATALPTEEATMEPWPNSLPGPLPQGDPTPQLSIVVTTWHLCNTGATAWVVETIADPADFLGLVPARRDCDWCGGLTGDYYTEWRRDGVLLWTEGDYVLPDWQRPLGPCPEVCDA